MACSILSSISIGFASLIRQLEQLRSPALAYRQLTVTVPVHHYTTYDSLLNWLGLQTLYPKGCWSDRRAQSLEIFLGNSQFFHTLQEANSFLATQQYPFTLWGGLPFHCDGTERYLAPVEGGLFLPRFLISIQRNEVVVQLTLHPSESNADYARLAQWMCSAGNRHSERADRGLQRVNAPWKETPDRSSWCSLFSRAQQALRNTDLKKVVLTREQSRAWTGQSGILALFQKSLRENRGCYHILVFFSSKKLFFSASPELLFLREGEIFLTEALAGSSLPGSCAPLLKDTKNNYENILVLQDIVLRLGEEAALVISAPEQVFLPYIQHVKRRISGEKLPFYDTELLKRLHGTAAVVGFPAPTAKQFLMHYEPITRGWYTGSFGYFSHKKTEVAVLIRSLSVEGAALMLYAGAGIVLGSEVDSEWEEISQKFLALKRLL